MNEKTFDTDEEAKQFLINSGALFEEAESVIRNADSYQRRILSDKEFEIFYRREDSKLVLETKSIYAK